MASDQQFVTPSSTCARLPLVRDSGGGLDYRLHREIPIQPVDGSVVENLELYREDTQKAKRAVTPKGNVQ